MTLRRYMQDVTTRPSDDTLKRIGDVLRQAKKDQYNTGTDEPHLCPIDGSTILMATFKLAKDVKDVYELRQAIGWVMANPQIKLWSKHYVETMSETPVAMIGWVYHREGLGYFDGKQGREDFNAQVIKQIEAQINALVQTPVTNN